MSEETDIDLQSGASDEPAPFGDVPHAEMPDLYFLAPADTFAYDAHTFERVGTRIVCRHADTGALLFQCPMPINLREAMLMAYSLGYRDGRDGAAAEIRHLETLIASHMGDPVEFMRPMDPEEYAERKAERDAKYAEEMKSFEEEQEAAARDVERVPDHPPIPLSERDLDSDDIEDAAQLGYSGAEIAEACHD